MKVDLTVLNQEKNTIIINMILIVFGLILSGMTVIAILVGRNTSASITNMTVIAILVN
ncbi:hypothetical protein [Oceanobacillus arenosus]|uniref:hypothetical protein n=1 Tax=Oceanobacillus arenosus TaxID=1229153 RepID=UPI001B874837|nr:hypothetical protein [Oceanobacillus arenosus]